MKRNLLYVAAALLLVSCGQGAGEKRLSHTPELKNQIDTLSWAYGQNIASVMHDGYFNQLDADLILQSARYALDGGEDQPLTPEQTKEAIEYIMMMYSMSARQQASATQQDVQAQEQAYFDKLTKENPNVKRHPKGFYYEVLKQGKGANAKYGQRIEFDYRSYLMFTGEAYDQTDEKRPPIVHVVGEPMFPGLIEGFQLMNAGSIYRFYFPYELAFGAQGSGDIPGFTPLIYDIELHQTFAQ